MAVKSTAGIYMQELRGFDATIVPLFTPDSVVDVGDFGSFKDGRFAIAGSAGTTMLRVVGPIAVNAISNSSSPQRVVSVRGWSCSCRAVA